MCESYYKTTILWQQNAARKQRTSLCRRGYLLSVVIFFVLLQTSMSFSSLPKISSPSTTKLNAFSINNNHNNNNNNSNNNHDFRRIISGTIPRWCRRRDRCQSDRKNGNTPLYHSIHSNSVTKENHRGAARRRRWFTTGTAAAAFDGSSNIFPRFKTMKALLFLSTVMTLVKSPKMALAAMAGGMGASTGRPAAPMERKALISLSAVFLTLFIALALLHACEIAITTLYPWKVREIAEEEEKMLSKANNGNKGRRRSTFKILNEDITKVLTTILVASTTSSIFATTIFTRIISSAFGARGEKYGAIGLTALTLFFVELLPKSIGVTNAEKVARLMVPPVNILSSFVSPLGITLNFLAKKTLRIFGIKNDNSDDSISNSQLRLIVTGARDSGTIDTDEQEMIQGVLNLQEQRVKEIMKPRVEMIAVPQSMSVSSVLGVVRESGYSRIPVYEGEIDNIIGVVIAKSVLDFFVKGVIIENDNTNTNSEDYEDNNSLYKANQRYDASSFSSSKRADNIDDRKTKSEKEEADIVDDGFDQEELSALLNATTDGTPTKKSGNIDDNSTKAPFDANKLASRMKKSIYDAKLIESCYFVPGTANGWSVLQEMRRRRVHMGIVVDEFGGTEGLVSLEDIVEQVVGEIYDEDDDDEMEFSEDSIILQENGTYIIRGDADLEHVDTILGLNLDESNSNYPEAVKEFATLSGFLCMVAGEIPMVGNSINITVVPSGSSSSNNNNDDRNNNNNGSNSNNENNGNNKQEQTCDFEIMNTDEKRILQVRVKQPPTTATIID